MCCSLRNENNECTACTIMKDSKINLQYKGFIKTHEINAKTAATMTHESIPVVALLLTPCDSWKFAVLWLFTCAGGSG